MRAIRVIVMVVAAAMCGFGAAFAQPTSATLGIDGLTCSMCAKGAEASLRRLKFIKDVKMDLNALTATIDFKADANISIDKLAEAVNDAGFSVREASVLFEFRNVKVGKDVHVEWSGAQYHFVDAPETTFNGLRTLRIIDKGFIDDREYEQWKKAIRFECYETGVMKPCCSVEKSEKPMRVYHVAMTKK